MPRSLDPPLLLDPLGPVGTNDGMQLVPMPEMHGRIIGDRGSDFDPLGRGQQMNGAGTVFRPRGDRLLIEAAGRGAGTLGPVMFGGELTMDQPRPQLIADAIGEFGEARIVRTTRPGPERLLQG
jgi:hypothetical protein